MGDEMSSTLALDLGTNLGWALRSPAGVNSGTASFPKRPKDHDGDRLLRFSQWLTQMKDRGVELVVYERAMGVYKNARASRLFPQFEAVLLLWCARHAVPIKPVHQSTLKVQAAGSGKAEKHHIGAAVRALGYKPANDDEADALALLLTHTGELKATPWPKAPRKPKRGPALPLDAKPF